MNEWEFRLLEERPRVERVPGPGGELRTGSHVRLRPRRGSDAIDLLLAGRTAVIEAIEQDYEGRFHLALVFDDDPGRDLDLMRQPGHRFFYAPDEVELCEPNVPRTPAVPAAAARPGATPSILVACIGNIFLVDDGFGVEVARRLAARPLPEGVRVVDYGIRGLDLTYALMNPRDVTILVDAYPHGQAPGTLSVIEPDQGGPADEHVVPDAHAMHPMAVLRAVRSMGGTPGRLLLVGCEPATPGPDEGHVGLSQPVEGAIDRAVDLVLDLVRDIRAGGPAGSERQPPA